jgi:hypothetical protein
MAPLLAGFGLGFTVAASFGPINIFALASGLRHGFWPAYGVSLGASTADGVYAFLGGVGAAALFTGNAKGWFQAFGGAALVLIAVRMVRGSSGEERRTPGGFGRSYMVALAVTLANPLTVVYWGAAFAGVVPKLELSRAEAMTSSGRGRLWHRALGDAPLGRERLCEALRQQAPARVALPLLRAHGRRARRLVRRRRAPNAHLKKKVALCEHFADGRA